MPTLEELYEQQNRSNELLFQVLGEQLILDCVSISSITLQDGILTVSLTNGTSVSGNVEAARISKSDIYFFVLRPDNSDEAKTLQRIVKTIKADVATSKVAFLYKTEGIYSSKEEYQRESETATPPAPKPASRSRDDRTDHPAIQAVRLVTNRFPDKVVWDKLISELGTPDLQKLTSCHVEWVARGFKPTNLAWAFEWYKNGIPEKQSNGTNRQNQNGNGRKSTLERIADHADIIAQYPTEAELRGQS